MEVASSAPCAPVEPPPAAKVGMAWADLSAEQLEAMPAAEKSQRQLAAAWAALKRGKRPARPNDDLPKQEL